MTMTARYRGNKSCYQATYMALECNDYEPQRKVRPRRQINSANCRTYIVIRDPIPVDRGGFAPGAVFGVCEIEEMLSHRAGRECSGWWRANYETSNLEWI